MAEPARRLDDEEQPKQVYDQPGNKPDLRVLEGGGQTTEPKRDHLREADSETNPSREELSSAEESTNENSGKSPSPHEDSFPGGYWPGQKSAGRFSLKGRITGRRALFGGGILGLIISVVVFFFLSGPLEFVHLSQVLQKNFFHSEFTVQVRNKGLFRYA